MHVATGLYDGLPIAHLDPAAPPPPIEAVLFDFSATLFQPIEMTTLLAREHAARGWPADPDALAAIDAALATAYQLAEVQAAQAGRDISPEAHRAAYLAWLGAVPEIRHYAGALYDRMMTPASFEPYPDTGPVLRELAARGVPFAIVSDVAWHWRPVVEAHGLGDVVEHYVLSYEYGVEKPDPKLFRAACELLGSDPRATLMVGDNPLRDGGAVLAGLRVYLLPTEPRTGERGLSAVLRLLG
jgi:HAD superfamily hydrolase (TIGR01509 family)